MIFHRLATAVVVFHVAFVAFVVAGGFLALRWRPLVWAHLPAAIWGALIEFGGWTCPLTPLENALRSRAGEAGYRGSFIEHYMLRALYPSGLTRTIQWLLGAGVIAINTIAYTLIVRRRRAAVAA